MVQIDKSEGGTIIAANDIVGGGGRDEDLEVVDDSHCEDSAVVRAREDDDDDDDGGGGEDSNDDDESGSSGSSSDDDDSSSGDESEDDDEEPNDGLSSYERLRLEKIARNKARLAQLGFSEPKQTQPIKKKKTPIKSRKKSLDVANRPRRENPGRAKRATFNTHDEVSDSNNNNNNNNNNAKRRIVKEKNLNACDVCQKEEGELRCCDYCRKLYHPQCHTPPISPDDEDFKCHSCESAGRSRRSPCGKCEGCIRTTDCMTCVACVNKYDESRGGHSSKCIFRKCRSWGKARVVCNAGNNNNDNDGEDDDGEKKREEDGGEEEDDGHDVDCYVCKTGGDLICCDSCPKVFHSNCHKPKIYNLPEGKWNCQHCVLESKKKAMAAAATPRENKTKRTKYKGKLIADLGDRDITCTVRFPKIECTVCEEVDATGVYQHPEWVSCRSCDDSYHLKCLDPPLQSRPNTWRCPNCKKKDVKVKKEKEESKPLFKGEHDDDCFMCFLGGELICCDYCSKAYHLQCHLPPLTEIPTGLWKCQECAALEYTRKFKCGECEACQREDCGKCIMCLDKPKNGGANKLRQTCVMKKCPYMRYAPPMKATPQSKKKKTKKELTSQFGAGSSPCSSKKKRGRKSKDDGLKIAQNTGEEGPMSSPRKKSQIDAPKRTHKPNPKSTDVAFKVGKKSPRFSPINIIRGDTPKETPGATPLSISKKKKKKESKLLSEEDTPPTKKRKLSRMGGHVEASQIAQKVDIEALAATPTIGTKIDTPKQTVTRPIECHKVMQTPKACGKISNDPRGQTSKKRKMPVLEATYAKKRKDSTQKEIAQLLERPLRGDSIGKKIRTIVIKALKNPDNSEIQDKACGLLRFLATCAENVSKIIRLGGLNMFSKAAKNHLQNSRVQAEACALLLELVCVSPSCIAAVIEEGCLQLVSSSMQWHGAHDKVQQMGCGFFRATSYNFAHHTSIESVDGVKAVINAMERYQEKYDILKEGTFLLQNLLCNQEITTETIDLVVSAIPGIIHNAEAACGVLTNLVNNENAKAHVGHCDPSVLASLLTSLKPGNAHACQCFLNVLTLLATWDNENTTKIGHLGGITTVMNFLTLANDVALTDTGMKLMAELTRDNQLNAQSLLKWGGLEFVSSEIHKHLNLPNILSSCCGVLRNLPISHAGQAKITVRLILSAMNAQKEDAMVQFEACHALLNCCSQFPSIAESIQSSAAFPIGLDDVCFSRRKPDPSSKSRKVEETDQPTTKGCAPSVKGRPVISLSQIDSIIKSKPLKGDPVGNKIRLVIVKALKNHDNPKVQEKACETLWRMASNVGNASKIILLGGLKMVSKAMMDHPQKGIVQAEACALLSELTWIIPSCAATIFDEGLLQLVLSSMQCHETNLKVQHMACGFFRAMSDDFESHSIINSVDGVGNVIDAMKRYPKKYDILKEGCYFMQNILCNPSILPETIELIVSKDVVPLIIDAMRDKTNDVEYVTAACGLLANLVIDESAREHVGKYDLSVPTLLAVVGSGTDMDARKCSLNALSFLATGNDVNIASIISLDGIKTLMDFLTPPNDVVLAYSGMRLLAELTKNSKVNSQMLMDTGGLEFVTNEIANNADSPHLQARAFRVLRNLPIGLNKVDATVHLILKSMETHEEDSIVQYEGCHVLMSYCCRFPIGTAEPLCSKEAGPILAYSRFQMPTND